MKIIVLKFGGTSVGSLKIQKVAKIISTYIKKNTKYRGIFRDERATNGAI